VYEEIEADGWDARRRIPQPEAYNRLVLRPDPHDAIVARGEHEIWHAALCALAETLTGRLTSARPLPPGFAARPWENICGGRAPVILPDLRPQPAPSQRKRRANKRMREISPAV